MSGEGIGETLGCLMTIVYTSIVIVILLTGYLIFDKSVSEFESKTIIKPDYRLEVNGKKIDTIYIYKIK